MMVAVLIIIASLILVFGIICVMKLSSLGRSLTPPPAEVDVSLKDVNEFIRKEFLFEFIKWISSAPTSIDMSGPDRNSTFVNDLKNPEILNKKISIITSLIISKMSVYLIREFKAVYKADDDSLYEYVARQILFYIRRVDTEITTLFETMKDTKTTDILKQYVVAIESEIYKTNDVIIARSSEGETSSGGSK